VGKRADPVDVLLDHRHPVVREVARQLRLHARLVDGDVGRHDEGVAVALLPQRVDHGRHQAQDAARALELEQRRPVGVEAVEDLRVDRVRCLDALLVVGVGALRRKLLVLHPVEVGERPRHHVPVLEVRRVGHRLEQPPPHDLETLLGGRRMPRRLDASHHVAQAVERLAASLAADFDIVGLRVG